jgi:NACHT domain
VLLAGTTVAVLIVARVYHLGVAATVVAVLIALPALWLAWVPYRDDQHKAPDARLEDLADQLAVALERQWKAETAVRRLNDPYPLPVSWSAADPDLTDRWDLLEKLARSGAGWPAPPPPGTWAADANGLEGRKGELAEVLRRIPTGRLVVLGKPGAGKTMLVVRLVLDLLRDRPLGAPVPFLAPLASWNPSQWELRGWLATQLVAAHPRLAAPAPGGDGSCAEALLAGGLIIPVLDGLDEIPEAVRGVVISQINDALRPGEAVVVTCRTEDYRRAVSPPDGPEVTLTAAAASGHEKIPVCGQLGPAVRSSEFPADGH